eukprot:8795522-Pyramimonas_sp.AAC.1
MWVRERFRCSECAEDHRAGSRRRVAFPGTFRNHIVGMGLFYIDVQGVSHPFINAVDHRSNLQVYCRAPNARAATVWVGFVQCWLRLLGPPHFMISDGGSDFAE